MPATASGWTALALVGTAGAVTYSAVAGHQESKAAREQAKKEAEKQRKLQEQLFNKELEAGEYFEDLQMQQMELQAQSSNINTLANLIASRKEAQPGPQVFTLPAAKTEDPLTRINKAIGELIRRN